MIWCCIGVAVVGIDLYVLCGLFIEIPTICSVICVLLVPIVVMTIQDFLKDMMKIKDQVKKQ